MFMSTQNAPPLICQVRAPRPLRRTSGGVATDLVYEGTAEDLAASATGSTTTTYAYTPGSPLAQQVGSADAQVFLRDLHGDVVGYVSQGASVPDARTYYSPWGEACTTSTADLGYQGDPTPTPAKGRHGMIGGARGTVES